MMPPTKERIMKNKIIKLIIKNVYGVDRVYPACEVAENLALLTKKKTFDWYDLRIIKDLGYELEYIARMPDFAGAR